MTITIRASSLPHLFDCPARWASIHIEGKHMPSSGKAMLGKAVHASTAKYDQSVLDGAGLTVDETAAAVIDTIYSKDEEVLWEDESPREAEKIAISLHTRYCQAIAPKQNYRAVEVKCDRLDITDLGISLTGTTDRVRITDDGFSICDIKTGKAAVAADGSVKTAGHSYQMGVYELLAEKAGGLPITGPAQIIGMNTAKTAASQRIGTGEILGAREVLLGDGQVQGILETAAKVIHGGNFWGNPKSMMCHEKYCPNFSNCRFRR
jgi:PD-(D/E)XK nuclease superfamily